MATMTGCEVKEKEEMLVCTNTQADEGMDVSQTTSLTYKNDKLKHMTIEMNTKITDDSVKEVWEEFKKSILENDQEVNKEGVVYKVEMDDQNYTYHTTLDIDVENASEEALKEQGFEDLKDDQSTLESNKETAEKDGETCRVETISER